MERRVPSSRMTKPLAEWPRLELLDVHSIHEKGTMNAEKFSRGKIPFQSADAISQDILPTCGVDLNIIPLC